jgi:hypothetical protein
LHAVLDEQVDFARDVAHHNSNLGASARIAAGPAKACSRSTSATSH